MTNISSPRHDSMLRNLLLASTAVMGVLTPGSAAYAACAPNPGNNVTATCTDTTTNQNNPNGYGTGAETNLNITVVQGATVTGTNAALFFSTGTVTNSGTLTGTNFNGVEATADATVTNSGLVIGGFNGVKTTGAATVANSGSIMGTAFNGISAGTTAAVTNSGLVTGGFNGIQANSAVTVTNSGSITGVLFDGIVSNGTATIANSGNIIGSSNANGIGIIVFSTGSVVNSGTIIGGSGTAIQFNTNATPASDALTVLPGARFGGLVNFGGGADTVNFGPGSWILRTSNFDTALSSVNTAGNPYVVTPSQIVVADASGFGAQNRAIVDIVGWINSVLPDAPVIAQGAGGGVRSFAAVDTSASPFEAFAGFPSDALGYAKAPAFKAASVAYADGNAVWAKGFGGQRQQDSNGQFIGGTTTGYGGAVGYERMINPDMKIGVLAGGSTNKTNLYLNADSTNTDTVFGGAYGRQTWGGTFLDLAVIAGNLDNANVRNISGGLAFQTATASYGGWFVDPSLTAGRRFDIDGRGFTITPAVKARYLAAHFDGYTETGSSANLTVAGRNFQAWEERAELTFANTSTMGNGNRVTARVTIGALAQQRSAGGQVNIALLGQNFLAATPDRGSITGGFGSAGLDWQMGNVALFALGEATSTNDSTRTYAGKGGVRVSW